MTPASVLSQWLDESGRVLIGAGAGLTAAAGFDYSDTAVFQRLFPALAARGFSAQYQMIGQPLPRPLLWGYWFTHVHHVRFADHGPSSVYEQLQRMTRGKDRFVHTSNVDALFTRNGFDSARVHTPQGDYALLQCTIPCTRQVWPVEPVMKLGLSSLDISTGEVTDPDALPSCPSCGSRAFLNVRVDASFIDDHLRPAGKALASWLESGQDEPLLILEIGAGFSTPTVVRFPLERLARALPDARFVRINRDHPAIPAVLQSRGLSIGADIASVLAEAAALT
jgi:NAD-dependent SIR2 family protein deacetylase